VVVYLLVSCAVLTLVCSDARVRTNGGAGACEWLFICFLVVQLLLGLFEC
jgi:hypothetical protein